MIERFLRLVEPRCPGITLAFVESEEALDAFLGNLNPEKKAEIALIMKHLWMSSLLLSWQQPQNSMVIVHRARLTWDHPGKYG